MTLRRVRLVRSSHTSVIHVAYTFNIPAAPYTGVTLTAGTGIPRQRNAGSGAASPRRPTPGDARGRVVSRLKMQDRRRRATCRLPCAVRAARATGPSRGRRDACGRTLRFAITPLLIFHGRKGRRSTGRAPHRRIAMPHSHPGRTSPHVGPSSVPHRQSFRKPLSILNEI